MANFTRLRANLAAWFSGSTVTPEEFDAFDANMAKSPNFAEGCTFAPTSAINLGGTSGLVLAATTPLYANGNTSIGATPSNTLSISATTTCTGPTTVKNNWTMDNTAGSFSCARPATFSGALSCTAAFTASGDVTLGSDTADTLTVAATETHTGPETHGGAETHNGAVTCSNTVTLNGTVNCGGVLNVAGQFAASGNTVLGNSPSADVVLNNSVFLADYTGHVEFGAVVLDSATSHTATATQTFVIQSPMTGAGALALSTTGMGSASAFKFVRSTDTVYQLAVTDGLGGTLVLLQAGTAAVSAMFYFNGTRWQLLMVGT